MSSHGATPPEAVSVPTSEIQTQMHIAMDTDLIIEILLRLPVKSILRFKAVCTFWRSLISDPLFASLHFQRASPTLVFTNPHSIRTLDVEGPLLHYDRLSEPINCHFLPNYEPFNDSDHVFIRGSCRGFLLIEWKNSHHLWNPSTHVHKTIPSSPVVDTNVFDHLYGFGYDSSRDDYLVVRLPITGEHQPTNLRDVQFFSFRANMWKYTEGVDLPPLNTVYIDTGVGLLFNEAIHWLARNCVHDIATDFIISFDLMEKRVLEIPLPHHDFIDPWFTLWVHGRFLSLSAMQIDGTCEIWVMKKYKVQTSWTKTVVLSTQDPVQMPVCSTKGGDIVTLSSSELTKYSDEGVVQGEQLEYQNHCGLLVETVPMYTESMFSLPDVSD